MTRAVPLTVAGHGLVHSDFYCEHRLSALNFIAARKINFVDALAVDVRAVGGAEVAQEDARRGDFEQTVMAREKAVFGKTQVSGLGPPDEKGIVLVKGEGTPDVRA